MFSSIQLWRASHTSVPWDRLWRTRSMVRWGHSSQCPSWHPNTDSTFCNFKIECPAIAEMTVFKYRLVTRTVSCIEWRLAKNCLQVHLPNFHKRNKLCKMLSRVTHVASFVLTCFQPSSKSTWTFLTRNKQNSLWNWAHDMSNWSPQCT